MANPDFEIVPFVFQPARDEGGSQTWQAWEGERRGGGASPPPARASRATRASPARPQRKLPPPRPSPRPRPPALRRPLDAARFVGWPDTREPCICPAHGTEYVRWVQSALNRIEGLALPVDGVMSAATRSALRAFQGRNNLPGDGIAGPDTEQVLRDARRPADASAAPSEPGQDAGEVYDFETLALESPVSRPTLRQGSSGSAVTDLQRQLAAAGFSPGPADGIFGAQTGAAVRSIQRARGLVVDGIVGAQTWGALLGGSGGGRTWPVAPAPAPAPVRSGSDPLIEALNLAEPARSAAYGVKARHPWVRFTSGRRDVPGQASAMAGNVVLNRQWIEQTYADNPVSRAAQLWIDAHPEARSKEAISAGLLGVLRGFSSAELVRLSYHLSGLAFDIQPVSGQLSAISATVKALPRLKEFLTREGGLERWHVALM